MGASKDLNQNILQGLTVEVLRREKASLLSMTRLADITFDCRHLD